MATLENLASIASNKLGADPISSLSEETREAGAFNTSWQHVMDRCLDAERWSFATKTLELTKISATPSDPSWRYEFQLPADHRVTYHAMDVSKKRLGTGEYIIEGDKLLSDKERVWLKYGRTFKQADVAGLPSWFRSYFATSLAYENSESITGLATLKSDLYREIGELLKRAKRAEGYSTPGASVPRSSWSRVRARG